MTQKQPEALRLAEIMDDMPFGFTAVSAELRRLHEVNAELLAALKSLLFAASKKDDQAWRDARADAAAAIAKAERGAA